MNLLTGLLGGCAVALLFYYIWVLMKGDRQK